MLWVIKSIDVLAILFPIMVLAMCFIRKGLDFIFTQEELKWLDQILPSTKRKPFPRPIASAPSATDFGKVSYCVFDVFYFICQCMCVLSVIRFIIKLMV
ncbi:unnamed protein product [Trichobilharzia regenti]|nr:unnamed protein product [Trichobilharzia regenti]